MNTFAGAKHAIMNAFGLGADNREARRAQAWEKIRLSTEPQDPQHTDSVEHLSAKQTTEREEWAGRAEAAWASAADKPADG
jgi:hypothetical protein